MRRIGVGAAFRRLRATTILQAAAGSLSPSPPPLASVFFLSSQLLTCFLRSPSPSPSFSLSLSLNHQSANQQQYKTVAPLGDRVFVKVDESEGKSAGGILLPSAAQVKSTQGVVTKQGSAKSLSEGDRVLYSKYAGTEIKMGKEEFVLLKVKAFFFVEGGGRRERKRGRGIRTADLFSFVSRSSAGVQPLASDLDHHRQRLSTTTANASLAASATAPFP